MSGLMAFHAHPDDETTSTGGTLARYADRGEELVVVTATDGAEGEIHNYDNPEDLKPQLTNMRAVELTAALKVLGVQNHEFLGYRDSGMMGTEPNADERCFWQADFMEATARLIKLIRRYQPEVMVIYDPFGGYGHPDHIQVHRIGLSAYWGALDLGRFPLDEGEELWRPSKLYWSAWPRTRVQGFAKARLEAGLINEEEYEQQRHGGTPDEMIDAWIDVKDVFGRKEDAWRAHRTQIPEDWFFFQVPADIRPTVFGLESFVRVFSDVEVQSPEDDLFTGLR